ncbi:hypothetical protein RRG08_005726 [Elysia crispata]|uniref:Uncharacterized protein n=1 Tax=Elysia crispata TaxID=231223 RepID=A0AAE0YD27_9GAST|nr:hypothetical protein RRG08_005726 [Elysia crispata]
MLLTTSEITKAVCYSRQTAWMDRGDNASTSSGEGAESLMSLHGRERVSSGEYFVQHSLDEEESTTVRIRRYPSPGEKYNSSTTRSDLIPNKVDIPELQAALVYLGNKWFLDDPQDHQLLRTFLCYFTLGAVHFLSKASTRGNTDNMLEQGCPNFLQRGPDLVT